MLSKWLPGAKELHVLFAMSHADANDNVLRQLLIPSVPLTSSQGVHDMSGHA